MKTLITGGAGFVGSHLAEYLLDKGHTVLVVDDLSTGSVDNIIHLKAHANFEFTYGSIIDVPLTAQLVDRCDMVFHLAAAVGVRLIVENPVRTIETNIRGTEIILDLANKKKRPVIITSTSEVYGKSSRVPFSEDDDLVLGPTVRGRWSYACSKAIDEFLALAYWREKKLPVVVARLFNTVGPRQTGRYGMVLPSFVRQAEAGEEITVYGDGTQSRCFCHVSDVVRALTELSTNEESRGEVFNIGSQEEITILELAQKVKSLSGSSSPIRLIPYEKAYEAGFEDMRRRVPNLEKIRGLIGYEPRYGIDAIIQSVLEFERSRRA